MNETLKDGRYVLLGSFAEGAQGKTFDAVDKLEGRAVVIKRFEVRTARSWKDVELAEREVNVLRSLSHPKLPTYFDHFEEDGALFLVMQKIEGESLGARKRRGGVLTEAEARLFLEDAADVLTYLHKRTPPVIHRDLKPGNVIRRPDGSFAFVDFGAVRDRLKPEGGSTVVGTFGYMAPEQFQGRALPASDVYSVGATVLTMMTGVEPEDLPHKGLAIDVRAALQKTVREDLVEVLVKMLEPDPDKRAAVIPRFDPRKEEKRTVREKRREVEAKRPYVEDSRREKRTEKKRADREQKAERRREKIARRAGRRAERIARARERRGRSARPPWPIAMLFTLGIMLGTVAVALALKAIVPLILRILSMFFAREGLRRGADAVSNAGDHAITRMRDAQTWLHTAPISVTAPGTQVRVEEERVRVDPATLDHDRDRDRDLDLEHDHDLEHDPDRDPDRDPEPRRKAR